MAPAPPPSRHEDADTIHKRLGGRGGRCPHLHNGRPGQGWRGGDLHAVPEGIGGRREHRRLAEAGARAVMIVEPSDGYPQTGGCWLRPLHMSERPVAGHGRKRCGLQGGTHPTRIEETDREGSLECPRRLREGISPCRAGPDGPPFGRGVRTDWPALEAAVPDEGLRCSRAQTESIDRYWRSRRAEDPAARLRLSSGLLWSLGRVRATGRVDQGEDGPQRSDQHLDLPPEVS